MSDKKTEKLFTKALTATRKGKGKGVIFGSNIPTQAQWESNELRSARVHEERVNAAPLSERKEKAIELLSALKDPRLMQERIGWLIDGNYGKGPQLQVEQVLAGSARSNKHAAITQLIGVHEWGVPRVMTVNVWKKLTHSQQAALSKAIDAAIAAASVE